MCGWPDPDKTSALMGGGLGTVKSPESPLRPSSRHGIALDRIYTAEMMYGIYALADPLPGRLA
jgi:hypothetical protein